MIIRKLSEILGTNREVEWGAGSSRRFLVARDNMPFSLTDTVVKAGTRSLLQYQNHFEACYCVSGSGYVENTTTGESHAIEVGTMYALDKHDPHYLVATKEDMRLVCVFSPPLRGDESHRLNGAGVSSY